MEDPKELARTYAQEFVSSLWSRDWEEPYVAEAMNFRRKKVQQLVAVGEHAVDPLIDFLGDPDWAVRSDVATILGYIRSQSAVQPLLSIIENDDSLSAQLSAASALERIHTPEAVEATTTWYRKHQISAQQRISTKIGEFLNYGETDAVLLDRARQLADRKNVALKIILVSMLHLWSSLPPGTKDEVRKRNGLVELSSEEVAYLEEPYEV